MTSPLTDEDDLLDGIDDDVFGQEDILDEEGAEGFGDDDLDLDLDQFGFDGAQEDDGC